MIVSSWRYQLAIASSEVLIVYLHLLKVTLPGDSAVERQFHVNIKWMSQVSLSLLDEAMEGRIRAVPFESVQAMDVILRHLPSLK